MTDLEHDEQLLLLAYQRQKDFTCPDVGLINKVTSEELSYIEKYLNMISLG